MDKILSIENLFVEYTVGKKIIPAVRNVSLTLNKADSLTIVGESGCGKSTLGLSILNLLPKEARIIDGKIIFHEQDILRLGEKELQKIRGGKIGIVFQDPLSSLNPVIKISQQLRETLKIHQRDFSDDKIEKLLETVQLSEPKIIKNYYPHQLSGGMRQRIMLAMAIATKPEILIADEPTTALDVTIQKEILELIKKLMREFNLTVIFITHNFGIISDICNKIAVMYAGEIVEEGGTSEIIKNPRHPYTKALLSAIPKTHKVKRFNTIPGNVPDLSAMPDGCKFHPRCPRKIEKCAKEEPQLKQKENRLLRCFNP
ncbi:MAG TPA: peptide ABC transporter ATP-binding protein [Elusimicrobia bacterium]|nr:peptide ABC transporter ATP-binding protein [Elusimicrobiota bacterium]